MVLGLKFFNIGWVLINISCLMLIILLSFQHYTYHRSWYFFAHIVDLFLASIRSVYKQQKVCDVSMSVVAFYLHDMELRGADSKPSHTLQIAPDSLFRTLKVFVKKLTGMLNVLRRISSDFLVNGEPLQRPTQCDMNLSILLKSYSLRVFPVRMTWGSVVPLSGWTKIQHNNLMTYSISKMLWMEAQIWCLQVTIMLVWKNVNQYTELGSAYRSL